MGFFGGGGAGGGVTNDAPVNAIPVTADGDGNLGDSKIASDGGSNPVIGLQTGEDGNVQVHVVGVGGQLLIEAASGDATHVGGELALQSGASAGQNGGDIQITAGSDSGEGDGGNISINSGGASDGADNGGNSGEIAIRAGGTGTADSHGGQIIIRGGFGRTGGGSIQIQGGARTVSGSHGTVQVYSADSSQGFEVNNTAVNINDKLAVAGNVGFYGTSPVARPNIDMTPTAQEIVDALVLLGLVTQS
jgi:hypothetical protein